MSLDAKQFLSKIQHELAAGSLEIAGFPEASLRLLRLLRDVFVSNQQLEQVVKSDPALTVRVVSMANSAAYQSSSGPVADARGAIARIGLATLRTVVLAHALATLREQKVYQSVQSRIGEIWASGLATSVVARAIASQVANPRLDREALALGAMLSGVGKIYLLSEMAHHQKVLEDFAAVEHLLSTWHQKAGRSLLEQWEFPSAVVRAATHACEPQGGGGGDDPLLDVLDVSRILTATRGDSEELARALRVSSAAARLGLATVDPAAIFSAAEAEAASMQGALA